MASIIVKWLDKGVHFGKEDSVKRKFIIEEGELEPGQKVTIQLSSRKGLKAKIWNAEVVSNAEKDTRPRESIKKTVPAHIKKSFEKLSNDDFTFELSAAPRVRRDLEEEKLQKRIEKMRREVEEEEKLFQQRREKRRREEEEEEEKWKKRREEREEYPISPWGKTWRESSPLMFSDLPPLPPPLPPPPPPTPTPSQQQQQPTCTTEMENRMTMIEKSLLSIMDLLSNMQSTSSHVPANTCNVIPQHILIEAKCGCRSRRNLAGRLALSLYTEEERTSSNYRGVLNKIKKLDPIRSEAIRNACVTEFPPKQFETPLMIQKEIREGMDEMCRRNARHNKL